MTLINRGRTPGPAGLLGDLEDDIFTVQPHRRPRRPGPVGTAPHGSLYYGSYADSGGGSGNTQPSLPTVKIVEPEATDSSYELRSETAPRFNGAPKPEDVIQGELAVCPLAAVLVAVAHAKPDFLQQMLPKATPATVISTLAANAKFRLVTNAVMTVQFRDAKPIEISTLLYYEALGDEDQAVYQIPYAHSDTGVSWVSFIEKAYAVWRGKNSYATLNANRQLQANDVMKDVVGPHIFVDLTHDRLFTPKDKGNTEEDLSNKRMENLLKAAKQHPTIAASRDIVGNSKIVANHGYAVLGFDGKKVYLRNPHGGTDANLSLSVADLKKNFEALLQALL
jgi:hypothetical protein